MVKIFEEKNSRGEKQRGLENLHHQQLPSTKYCFEKSNHLSLGRTVSNQWEKSSKKGREMGPMGAEGGARSKKGDQSETGGGSCD